MAITTGIIAAIGTVTSTGYSISKSEQAARDTRTASQKALADQATLTSTDATQAANTAALTAQTQARQRAAAAQGPGSTILTGGTLGAAQSLPRKTLLGS